MSIRDLTNTDTIREEWEKKEASGDVEIYLSRIEEQASEDERSTFHRVVAVLRGSECIARMGFSSIGGPEVVEKATDDLVNRARAWGGGQE